jgi:hypothetical protein
VSGRAAEDDELKRLHIEMIAWCKSQGFRKPVGKAFSHDSLGRGQSSSVYPEPHCSYRAASTKLVTMFLCFRVQSKSPDTSYKKLVITCCWAYLRYMYIVDHAEMYMTQQERAEACRAAGICLRCYARLSMLCLGNNTFLWKCRPKSHGFDHTRCGTSLCIANINSQTSSCMQQLLPDVSSSGRGCGSQLPCHATLFGVQCSRCNVRAE